jgi:hypothetical protein
MLDPEVERWWNIRPTLQMRSNSRPIWSDWASTTSQAHHRIGRGLPVVGTVGSKRCLGDFLAQPGSGQALRRWTCSLKMAACCLIQQPCGLMTIETYSLLWKVLPSHLQIVYNIWIIEYDAMIIQYEY